MSDYVRLTDPTNSQMKLDARQKMVDGRADVLNNAGRTLDRFWEYKDGKKTAAKVGTGLVIGAGVAAAGAATHGAAVPVAAVLGIAAGGYIAGKVADTSVGRMWDLGYKGASRTRAWIHDNGGHKDHSRLLEARAHKTIRHAVQHFRTAREKLHKAKQLPQFARMTSRRSDYNLPDSCDEAFNAITALLHVRHHLEKTRLYLHPATFLLGRLLDVHEILYARWNGQDHTQLQSPWHPPKACDSKKCYYDNSALTNRNAYPGDWVDLGNFSPAQRRKKVSDTLDELSMDLGLHMPMFGHLSQQTIRLIGEAESSYDENRDDCFVHAKHGVTNWWDRKTRGEQGAFVAKNAISLAVAGGAAGAHVRLDEALSTLAAAMDMGFTSFDLGASETIEDSGLPSGELRRDGKHAQEGLRHAAIHFWEALEVDHAIDEEHPGYNLRALTSRACERTIDYLRNVNKIQHHLAKVRRELCEMIDLIDKISKCTKRALEDVTVIGYEYGRYLEPFWMLHDRCPGRCYNSLRKVSGF
ncbi:MAG TPA: hypothetical protein VHW24_24720 [Bryobacteraceae bacterium]|nr:hypothetical protein [Bryobacteraceae bacterium]